MASSQHSIELAPASCNGCGESQCCQISAETSSIRATNDEGMMVGRGLESDSGVGQQRLNVEWADETLDLFNLLAGLFIDGTLQEEHLDYIIQFPNDRRRMVQIVSSARKHKSARSAE